MSIFLKAWNNFKTRPDIWFFGGFLLTFTLSIRKVFFFYPVMDEFNEYNGFYLYLSDILLILTILSWVYVILKNKKLKLSSCIQFFSQQEAVILAVVLLAWALMSISWSANTNLALFKALKLAEVGLLFVYVAYNALYKPLFRITVGFIVALGFIQAIIGISQIILQHSVGLFWLKESLISINIDGVAKVVIFGHKFIRAYGLFPHPNILGGFLLMSIILTFAYEKMFHACPVARNCSTWNNSFASGVKYFIVSWHGTIMYIILAIQAIALLLTFSKSAILGLFVAVCFLVYAMFHSGRNTNVPRETFLSYGAGVKHFYKYIITSVIFFGLFLTVLGFDIDSLILKSMDERFLFLDVSRGTIVENPIAGIGMGQFVSEMQKYSSIFLADWQYQPVHNVFLLIWSELGIIGLVLFILFLWKVFHANAIVPRETIVGVNEAVVFKAILLGFLIIMLFDHYLWDIQQGQIMLWIMLGLVAGANTKNNN